MKNLYDVDVLINEIEKETECDISEKKKVKYHKYLNELNLIRSKLSRSDYKFVFVGDKGIGKTSSIIELFNLVSEENDLLMTASGGTTTCEVEILRSDEKYTYFEIIPVDDEVMEQFVYDFCLSYKQGGEEDSDNIQYLPDEISRSVRNMIGMKRNEIVNLYNESESFEDFRASVLEKIGTAGRTETRIICESNEFIYVRDYFEKINLCAVESVGLPKKIKIFITDDIFGFSDYPYVRSIIDTRGIDSNISSRDGRADDKRLKRDDIMNYIDNEQDDCIFLFIDGIKTAPSNSILELFSSRLRHDNSHLFYLFINIYGNEAEEVMTDGGKAEDAKIGVEYKKEGVLEKLKRSRINSVFEGKERLGQGAARQRIR